MDVNQEVLANLKTKIQHHLEVIYHDIATEVHLEDLSDQLMSLMRFDETVSSPDPYQNNWDQQDVFAITYANSIVKADEAPLATLDSFLTRYFSQ